ncbi:MAG: SigE family RNA polymerase sigma factor [Dermatophilus congolensis]|nr:SigE family RNA polymerase sigma factor [Dermatophilus congolensis]
MSLEEFLAQHGQAMLRLGVMLTGSTPDAEDLLQSTLTRLWPQWDRVEGSRSPGAYAKRALVNTFTSSRRRINREVPWLEGLDPADSRVPRGSDTDEAWEWLATLPPTQRAVLALRYYEDLSDAEIGEYLDCSTSTVRSNAARALASLRTRFGDDHDPSRAEEVTR